MRPCYGFNMNQVLPTLMTVDEFLRWSVRQEQGRYELEGGRVVAMPAESYGHVKAKSRIEKALNAAIARSGLPYIAITDGMSVPIGAHRAYEPDALVLPLPEPSDDALSITNPVIVLEVLSQTPSSVRRDLTTKVAGYALVPSIQHYIVIDAAERLVLHYKRHGSVLVAPDEPTDGMLRLDPPGLEVPVIELLGPEPAA